MASQSSYLPLTASKRFLLNSGTAALRTLPPELAHRLGLAFLQRRILSPLPVLEGLADLSLAMTVAGLGQLPHPLGLAAGFDKNAQAVAGLQDLGFSFIELGTVTPLPQEGNPKPRLFRQGGQRALVNRMGFNSEGSLAVSQRLQALAGEGGKTPLGVNVGKNRHTEPQDALGDYLKALLSFGSLGSYYVVNISSPNTPGLRDLACPEFIRELAQTLRLERLAGLADIWLKLDPDMEKRPFQELVAAVAAEGFAGLVLTNTHRVEKPYVGGQSGQPLAIQATACLEWAYEVHRGRLAMIACGGVFSGADIYQKMIRGASAVQIYTAFIYRGPLVVYELLNELGAELRLRGLSFLADIVGRYYDEPSISK